MLGERFEFGDRADGEVVIFFDAQGRASVADTGRIRATYTVQVLNHCFGSTFNRSSIGGILPGIEPRLSLRTARPVDVHECTNTRRS